MVGDPGQLPPIVSADMANLSVAEHKVHLSAPEYLLDRAPDTPVYALPATRRFGRATTEIVQPAFYPDLPFGSLVDDDEHRLTFPVAGLDLPIDDALDALADGAGIVALLLPGETPPWSDADEELGAVMVRVVERALQRSGTWEGRRTLGANDFALIDPNTRRVGAVASELRARNLGTVVDTVEKWQGLQVPITVARHPLSRAGSPTPFDLDAGRWCVALSRHQLGCVIVARASVERAITDYRHRSDDAPAGAVDTTWAGFRAHRHVWEELRRRGTIFEFGA